MRNKYFLTFCLLLCSFPALLIAQKKQVDNTSVEALFSKKEAIQWTKHYKGRMDGVTDFSISLATDSINYKGYLTYIQSGESFKIEGQQEGEALILNEWDENLLKTGSLLILLTGEELYGEWTNIDGSIGASLYAVEQEQPSLTLSPCNDNKWINRYRSYYLDEEVDLLISRTSASTIWGSMWVDAEQKYYRLQVEQTDLNTFEGHLLQNKEQVASIQFVLDDLKKIEVSVDFRANRKYIFEFVLLENMQVTCRNEVDYVGAYDVIFPKTKSAACNSFLEKQCATWISDCKKSLNNQTKTTNPNTRAAVRASVWSELHLWDERYISGALFFSNTWSDEPLTVPFAYDIQRDKAIDLEGMFVKNFNVASWLEAFAIKESAQLKYWKHKEYRKWIKANGFPHLTLRRDGFLMSTNFHPIFGQSEILIPWASAKPYLRKSALRDLVQQR